MKDTFQISGPAFTPGMTTTGTVFIMGKPLKKDPTRGAYVLITAAHVLDEMSGLFASILLRRKLPDGSYQSSPFPIPIRNASVPLYVKSTESDVAVMYVRLPTEADIELLPTSFLVDDDKLNGLEVHPGDELLCLGFPLGIDFNSFPVIRSGLLASYPITPARKWKTFYYNFHVFPGNSGGPVYFNFQNRPYGGAVRLGSAEQGIVGLVTQQLHSNQPGYETTPLDIAIIIPAAFIIDTLAMLPEPALHEPSNVDFKMSQQHNGPAIK